MRTTLSLLPLILAFGCAPAKPRVWINASRAATELTESAIIFPQASAHIAALSPLRATLPSLSPSIRGQEQAEARRTEALQLMASQRAEVEATLVAAFTRSLTASAEAEIAGLYKALAEEAARRLSTTQDAVSDLFSPYAAQKGRILARLSLIAGFPKQRSIPEERLNQSALERAWKEEATGLMAELLALDAGFDSSVDSITTREVRYFLDRTAEVNSRAEDIRRRITGQAAALASEHMAATRPILVPPLLHAHGDTARPLPAQPVEVPSVGVMLSPAPVPSPPGPNLEALETQIEIFARVHGYKLADMAQGAQDKTAEFLAWLRQR